MKIGAKRGMGKPQWMKKFSTTLRGHLGVNYPIPRNDWTEAEYAWAKGDGPIESAAKIAERRMTDVGRREPLKVWVGDNGTLDFGTKTVHPSVMLTINSAVEGGCRHGTVKHWENKFPGSFAILDVDLVFYLWEVCE